MNGFKKVNIETLDIPFLMELNDKKSIRIFNKLENLHDDVIIQLEPCLCPFGLKKFDYIYVLTCSLANCSRKRIKDINNFEDAIKKKFNKLYPQYKDYRLHRFIDDHYRFTLSVNINDLQVYNQKLCKVNKDCIKPQCFVEPIICLYEIWIKESEAVWGINCKLLQCKIFAPFVSPNRCLFGESKGEQVEVTSKRQTESEQDNTVEKMKRIGVPVRESMPRIGINADLLKSVKLKPAGEQHKEPPKKTSIFRPPSVNELLEMKSRLKKTT